MDDVRGRKLKAPFPYFGGKSAIANLVWSRLGGVTNYVEPFCGSAAVLLARPAPFDSVETVNDVNGYITNFWRATARNPEAVAHYCNYPVSELDLHARHRWLVLSPEALEFAEKMRRDPDHYDAKIAGWWVWGTCCWIGAGWCGQGAWGEEWTGKRPAINHASNGVHRSTHEEQISEKVPLKRGTASGTHGSGVNAVGALKRPDIHTGRGGYPAPSVVNGTHEDRYLWLCDWFKRLQDRLRLVRICCGHWLRVCKSDSVTTQLGTTGLFLDPPYPTHRADTGEVSRDGSLYVGDNKDALDKLRDEILAYCLERGSRKEYRIALACYEGDGYELLESKGWECVAWRTQGGYGNRSEKGRANRGRERLYFSPHCKREASLFDVLED